MNKKSLTFLKDTPFFNSGIYDNKTVFENTTKAINNVVKNQFGLKTYIKITQDNQLICYKDDDLMRLLHVEDKIKTSTYDNICYIAKFPILKLNELLQLTSNIPVIFEIDKNNLDYKLKVMDELSLYEGNYAIISKDIDTLKWLYKNYPNVPIGYKVEKDNLHRFHLFKKYDFIVVNINLYDDKTIKRLKDDYLVIGDNVLSDDTFEAKKILYDNLICLPKLKK